MSSNKIKINQKIKEALQNNKPIVALESTLISHGLPYPDNIKVAKESINAVQDNGSVAATIGIINGKVKIGDFVGVGAGTSIHPCSSEFLSVSLEMPSIPKEFQYGGINERIIINNYCQIGAKNTILPGVSLPEGFASSANSVIRKKKYREWSLYGGNDSNFIYKRNPGPIKEITKKIKEKYDVYRK